MSVDQRTTPQEHTLDVPGSAVQKKSRPRFEFLDGIRGLAALYVVLFHVYYDAVCNIRESTLPWSTQLLLLLLKQGRIAVDVFIVLSGFCLMLPVVASPDASLPGGFVGYIRRRARRILPPYYAALAYCLAAIALVPDLNRSHQVHWDLMLPAFTAKAILSHLFLVHNLSYSCIYKINGSLWTVATEWQIYFVFPLLLLPIWRRFRDGATVAVGFAVAMALSLLSSGRLDVASPWYIGLFALGVAGASLSSKPIGIRTLWQQSLPWILAALLYSVIASLFGYRYHDQAPVDTMAGLATTALLIYCVRSKRDVSNLPLLVKGLESRACLLLGSFSYSLYLTHRPLLALYDLCARSWHLGLISQIGFGFLFAAPLALLFAYLFYCMFERRFQRSRTEKPVSQP